MILIKNSCRSIVSQNIRNSCLLDYIHFLISHFYDISFFRISHFYDIYFFYDISLFMIFYFYDISLLWYLYFYDISLSCNFHPWLIPNIRCFGHSAPHFPPGVVDNKENIEVRGPQYITDISLILSDVVWKVLNWDILEIITIRRILR